MDALHLYKILQVSFIDWLSIEIFIVTQLIDC